MVDFIIAGHICHYVGSLVGRDFKMVAQVAPFILAPYMDVNEKDVWLSLSKVGLSKIISSKYFMATFNFIT